MISFGFPFYLTNSNNHYLELDFLYTDMEDTTLIIFQIKCSWNVIKYYLIH